MCERERNKEGREEKERLGLSVRVCERERVGTCAVVAHPCVCVCERERERERLCIVSAVCVYVWVLVGGFLTCAVVAHVERGALGSGGVRGDALHALERGRGELRRPGARVTQRDEHVRRLRLVQPLVVHRPLRAPHAHLVQLPRVQFL